MKELQQRIASVCVLAASGFLAASAAAHHSDSIYFVDDRNAEGGAVRIEGVVTRVRLINPHAEIWVEVPGEDGAAVRWAIESDSWNELKTLGWQQDTIKVGDRVAVVVSMSKFHKTAGRLRDLMIYGATPQDDVRLFLEYIPDAADELGQSSAPLRLLASVPQCDGMIEYDPGRERGEETLLCMQLDPAALAAARKDFGAELAILR